MALIDRQSRVGQGGNNEAAGTKAPRHSRAPLQDININLTTPRPIPPPRRDRCGTDTPKGGDGLVAREGLPRDAETRNKEQRVTANASNASSTHPELNCQDVAQEVADEAQAHAAGGREAELLQECALIQPDVRESKKPNALTRIFRHLLQKRDRGGQGGADTSERGVESLLLQERCLGVCVVGYMHAHMYECMHVYIRMYCHMYEYARSCACMRTNTHTLALAHAGSALQSESVIPQARQGDASNCNELSARETLTPRRIGACVSVCICVYLCVSVCICVYVPSHVHTRMYVHVCAC